MKKILAVLFISCLLIILLLLLAINVIIPYARYSSAIAMMNAGMYEDAINSFESLGHYKDSMDKIKVCNAAILAAEYDNAVALMDAEEIVESYEALIALGDYRDSAAKANSIYNKYKIEKIKSAKIGDCIFWGSYEQDNNISNGKEEIEWIVLETKDNQALLISKYALDCKKYNDNYELVRWGRSSVRQWLNNDFIDSAFTADEKVLIPTVTISAAENPKYYTTAINTTEDKVFLLNIAEVREYFSSNEARQCKPTAYAEEKGVLVSMVNGNCQWWLRSHGRTQKTAAYVFTDGYIENEGQMVNMSNLAIRPSLWVAWD